MAKRITLPRDAHIETDRLLLRPPEETDLDSIVAEINDFAVVRMLAQVPFPYGRTNAERFLAWSRRSRDDLNLVVSRDGEAVGCMALIDVNGLCEFGYWLGRAHWRQGLASEAGRAFLAFCFATTGIDTIHAGAYVDNPASLHVQEKLGFRRTGRSRRQSLARGHLVEHIDTALSRAGFAEAIQ